jgi:hypothetical protein
MPTSALIAIRNLFDNLPAHYREHPVVKPPTKLKIASNVPGNLRITISVTSRSQLMNWPRNSSDQVIAVSRA